MIIRNVTLRSVFCTSYPLQFLDAYNDGSNAAVVVGVVKMLGAVVDQ